MKSITFILSHLLQYWTIKGWLQTNGYFCKNCSHVTWTNRKGAFDLSVLCMLWEKVAGRFCLTSLTGVGAMSWSLSLILRGHTGRAGAPRETATLGALRRSFKMWASAQIGCLWRSKLWTYRQECALGYGVGVEKLGVWVRLYIRHSHGHLVRLCSNERWCRQGSCIIREVG